MELQHLAVNIIELLCQRLDPLFKSSNFHVKFRESDTSIFAEHLRYEKDGIQIKITACVHPHDYPYSLSIQVIDKNCYPWRYINQHELLDLVKRLCSVHKSDLLIATDSQVQNTLDELYEIMECVLKNIFNTE